MANAAAAGWYDGGITAPGYRIDRARRIWVVGCCGLDSIKLVGDTDAI